jgi:hypothetical protein
MALPVHLYVHFCMFTVCPPIHCMSTRMSTQRPLVGSPGSLVGSLVCPLVGSPLRKSSRPTRGSTSRFGAPVGPLVSTSRELVGPLVGPLNGKLVGTLVGPLVGPLVECKPFSVGVLVGSLVSGNQSAHLGVGVF